MTEPPATEPELPGPDPSSEDERWEQIVASLSSAPDPAGSWPAAEDLPAPPRADPVPFRSWTPAEDPDDEHFRPPEPPPLPRVHPLTAWGVAALLVGLALLVVPAAFGNPVGGGSAAVAVLALVVGAFLLVARLRNTRDSDDDGGGVV